MRSKQQEKSIPRKRESNPPADAIAPQHQVIHGWLEDWGRWSREKRSRLACGSAEGRYLPRRPQGEVWEYEPPRASLPQVPNLQNLAVDRAVLRLPEQHRKAVKMFYVERRDPRAICRVLVLRWAAFPEFINTCRAMVLNLMRKAQVAPLPKTV